MNVKRILLTFLIFLAFLQIHAQRVIYVKAGSQGDGASWEQAFGDLQDALRTATTGTEIWVAAGRYLPTKTADRNASFVIPNGVILVGGFAGYETSFDERNWENNLTILSGEIGTPSVDDNSYTVVYTKNVTPATIIDGFVITAGTANGTGDEGDPQRCGAGWYNDGSHGMSSPTISNCLFINNYARDGAGLYNYAYNGKCKPHIRNSQFVSNHADLDGGAIFNNGSKGVCNPVVRNTLFKNNEAAYGAGMMNQGDNGECKATIVNCVFNANISYIRGSSVYNNREEMGICEATIHACQFTDNISTVGGDVSSTVNNDDNRRRPRAEIVFRNGYY